MAALTGKTVVIIHGWSDNWKSMKKVGDPLAAEGAAVHYADYESREDKAVYEDFAEGLHGELEKKKLLDGEDRSLHFVTHSTGALVLRQWFRQYPEKNSLAGNVVFLAPANFGSPLATMGASFIGKIFKGRHGTKYDNFEVGEKILHGLELASPFAWELAMHDLFGEKGTLYKKSGIRANVITGHKGYGGVRYFVNKPGTDGTIVVAGANLNSRMLDMDFTMDKAKREWRLKWKWIGFDPKDETKEKGYTAPDIPFSIHRNHDHASILELKGDGVLCGQVVRCLAAGPDGHDQIRKDFSAFTENQTRETTEDKKKEERMNYQQFVFHVVDDRGSPVPDYHLEFNVWEKNKVTELYKDGPRHVPSNRVMGEGEKDLSSRLDRILADNFHIHSQDPSFHRYLVRPEAIIEILDAGENGKKGYALTVRIDAKSGDKDITYSTTQFNPKTGKDEKVRNLLLFHPDFDAKIKPFFANTTTLIEMHVDRESTLVNFKP